MGIVKSLKGLTQYMDDHSGSGDKEKARWVKLGDGQTVKVWFLQELDPDADNYNESYGTGVLASEHSNPDDYRKKALCTIEEEGRCYGCEQNNAHPRTGWHSKSRYYINVLVDDGKDEPYVAVLSQGTSGKSITPTLAMFAGDAGTVLDSAFRLKRSGTGRDTSYTLIPIPKSVGVDPSLYDLYDIENKVLRHISYEDQEAFYSVEAPAEEEEPKSDEPSLEW